MPTSVTSEAFRTLRTALTLTHPDARRFVVTSTEPGDGKTTTLANLAVCYAQADKRVLLIDGDMRRPGLTGLMDMRGPHGLSEVLRSDVDIAQSAPLNIRFSGVERLDIMPCGARPSDPAELLSGVRLSQLLSWAETIYDVVLVDSPPTLATTDTAIIGRLSDGVILVVQPAKNPRRLVTRTIERLELMKTPVLGLVVNRVDLDADRGYYGYRSYGYGYGYGADEYGNEDNDGDERADLDGVMNKEESVSFAEGTKKNSNDDDGTRSLRIPRRVA